MSNMTPLIETVELKKYFKIKKDGHNLIRTKCQIALAKDMLQKLDAMDAIVKACVKKYK